MPIVYDTARLQEAAYPKDGGFLASQHPLEQLVNVIRYTPFTPEPENLWD